MSALVGALAAAMSEMSANFTTGRKKFADVADAIGDALQELGRCRDALLDLVDRDVAAYRAVDEAYSLPRETEEEKAARKRATDAALRGAMQAPLEVMRQCARVAVTAGSLVDIGNRNLITDVGVSAILAEAACAAARLNVEVNLKFLRAPELTQATTAEMDALSRTVEECREAVGSKVNTYLTG